MSELPKFEFKPIELPKFEYKPLELPKFEPIKLPDLPKFEPIKIEPIKLPEIDWDAHKRTMAETEALMAKTAELLRDNNVTLTYSDPTPKPEGLIHSIISALIGGFKF